LETGHRFAVREAVRDSWSSPVLLGVLVYGASAYEEWMGVLRDAQWTGAAMNASVVGTRTSTGSLAVAAAPGAARPGRESCATRAALALQLNAAGSHHRIALFLESAGTLDRHAD
jgi:hypothetical protein